MNKALTLRSFVNVITSYRSDPIGASGASAGVDLSSTLAEPAERSTNQKPRIFQPRARDGRRREISRDYNDKIENVRKYCECSAAYAHCHEKYATSVTLGHRHIVN